MTKYLTLLALLLGSTSLAEVKIAPRLIYVLQGGIDSIWGQHLFMVHNSGAEGAESKVRIVLPEETVDWEAQEGLRGAPFNLGANGGVEFTKVFKPGDNFNTVAFKSPASEGQGELTISVPFPVEELSFLVPEGLKLSGPGMQYQQRKSSERYDKYKFMDLKPGTPLKVAVSGIHEGRSKFQLLGMISGALLILISFSLAWYTRPKINDEAAI